MKRILVLSLLAFVMIPVGIVANESVSDEKLHRRWGERSRGAASSRRGPTASAAATRRPRGVHATSRREMWPRGRAASFARR